MRGWRRLRGVPRTTWVAVLVLAGLCAGVPGIRLDAGLDARFLAGDPAVRGLRQERARFGTLETVFLVVEGASPASPVPDPATVRGWAKGLEQIDGVSAVITPYDLPVPAWGDPDTLRLIPAGAAPDPRAALAGSALFRKGFLGVDARSFLVLLESSVPLEDGPGSAALVRRLGEWIAAQRAPQRFRLAGASVLQGRILEVAAGEAPKIMAAVLLGLCLLLGYALRSPILGAGTVAAAALATGATAGLGHLLALPLHHSTLMVFPIILAIAFLDNVHVVYAVAARQNAAATPGRLRAAARAEVLAPCVWTSVTTAGGFLTLGLSHVANVQTFGLYAALGTGVALAASLLVFLPVASAAPGAWAPRRLPPGLAGWAVRRRGWVVAGAAALAAVAFPGLLRLETHSEFPMLLDPEHPVSREVVELEGRWGGTATVSLSLRPRSERGWEDPDTRERLAGLLGVLSGNPHVTAVVSPLDLLEAAQRAYRDTFAAAIPPEALLARVREAARAGGGEAATDLASRGFDPATGWLRLVARTRISRPAETRALLADLQGVRRDLGDLFEVELTGWPVLFAGLERTLLREWTRGFLWALAVVALLLRIAFRSWRWWLLALPVNLAPLLITAGALGYLNVPVGMDFLLIPGMALGIIVDDTIHFVWSVRRETRAGGSLDRALGRTLRGTGTPMALTTAVLAVAFGALHLSSFREASWMAHLMTAVLALALAADFLLVPALVAITRPGSRRTTGPHR